MGGNGVTQDLTNLADENHIELQSFGNDFGDVKVLALYLTMEHLNTVYGKPVTDQQTPPFTSSFWRRRPGRYLQSTWLYKVGASIGGWVTGPFRYVKSCFGSTAFVTATTNDYKVVTPWVPGYPYGRNSFECWMDGAGSAFTEMSETDLAEWQKKQNSAAQIDIKIDPGQTTPGQTTPGTPVNNGRTTPGHVNRPTNNGNTRKPSSTGTNTGRSPANSGNNAAGARPGGDNTHHAQDRTNGNVTANPADGQPADGTPQGSSGQKKSGWEGLTTTVKVAIIGGGALVLILIAVAIFFCCKSDEEEVMPMHGGHYGHQVRSRSRVSGRSRVSRTPGRSRY